MKQLLLSAFAFLLLATLPAFPVDASEEPASDTLAKAVRIMLREEMKLMLDSSQRIVAALVEEDHDSVAAAAETIEDSFARKQELTKDYRTALAIFKPEISLLSDQATAFNALTAELIRAARDRDGERQSLLYGSMIQSCTSCHTLYSQTTFPSSND